MHRVRIAMQSSNKFPIETRVQVDEFVYGGKENLNKEEVETVKRRK